MKDKKWAQREVDRYLSYEGVNEARNALMFAKGVINQLDEPETLSQGWMYEHKKTFMEDGKIYNTVLSDDLQNLLVPKQELPVIPKYVADWIEDLKSKRVNLLESIYYFRHFEDINNYMLEQGNVLMRAWLDGYEVEEEQKYYVLGKHGTPILIRDYMNQIIETSNLSDIYPKADSEDFEFTEQEIKGYDTRYFAFAVPVEVAE